MRGVEMQYTEELGSVERVKEVDDVEIKVLL